MAESTKQDIQKSTPKISWKDVITINKNDFSNEDLIKLYQSLDKIENTKSGQVLLNGVMLRNKELELQDGKVEIAFYDKGFFYDPKNIILANPSLFDKKKIISFTNDGKPFEENITTVLFHEMVHHADIKVFAKGEEAIKLQTDIFEIVDEVGIRFTYDKADFSINKANDFFVDLSQPQRQALIELENAALDENVSQSEFAKLFESKKDLLLTNPKIKQCYDYVNKAQEILYDAELQAIKVTNEFNREIGMPERSGYNSSILLHRNQSENQSGKNPPTEPNEQQIDYAKWEAKKTWNEVKSDGKLTLPDLRGNPPVQPPQQFFIPSELQQQLSSLGGFPAKDNPSVQLATVPNAQNPQNLQR
jgi:hypothetical protein